MKTFLSIIVLFATYAGIGQPYRFTHITAADGLLSMQRIAMAEDRLGRIWISSDEGINLFDGYSLSSITEPGEEGLLHNLITSMLCDSKGTIWVSNSVATQYKPENSQQFINTYRQNKNTIHNLSGLFESASQGIIGAARDSCFQYQNGSWKYMQGLSGVIKKYGGLRDVAHVKEDTWLWACARQMILVNVASQKVERVYDFEAPWCVCVLNDSSFAAGSFVRDTTSLFNTWTGEQRFVTGWPTQKRGETVKGYAKKIAKLAGDKMAIATRYNGLYIVDISARSATHLIHDPGNNASISTNYSLGLFVSNNNTLFYIGTGLSYTSLSPPQMSTLAFFTNEKGLREDGVKNCFYEESKSIMWVGTNSSLVRWNRHTGECHYYPFVDVSEGAKTVRTIRCILADKLGRIWVGTFTGGLGMLKPDGSFEQYTTHADTFVTDQLNHREILSMTPMPDGQFFLCTNAGFCLFDPIAKKFKTFYNNPKLKALASVRMFYAAIDRKGGWWLASNKGGWYYDPATDKLVELTNTPATNNRMVISVAVDSVGNAYLGTTDGLHVIPAGTYTIQRTIRKQNGLASNYIMGLIVDKNDDLWIIGNRGLARYNNANNKLKTFGPKDGALQNNHKNAAFYLSKEGELFIGGEDGLNYFYPNALSDLAPALKLYVTNISTQDSVIYTPYLHHINLPHHQNNITLQYLVVDFNLAPYMQYRYQLNGFDTSWIYAGNQRQVRYTNLAPGNYSFAAQASLNGNDWYESALPLNIKINKAWYQLLWLQLLTLILLVCGLYLVYRIRIKKIHAQQLLTSNFEKKLSQVRMNMLRAQMNPHFIYNSLNSINSFILKSDRSNASGYLTKFSRLMRLILDNSRSEFVTLENELKALDLYIQLEALRFNEAFAYNIKHEAKVATQLILLPPMLLQPFVENAIWHGLLYRTEPGGMLQISVKEINQRLYIAITDNGVGRQAAALQKSKSALQNKSYGMKITEERIATVNVAYGTNAQVTIVDDFDAEGIAAGTTIKLELDCMYSTE